MVFLNIMKKKIISNIPSKTNKTWKLIFEKNNNLGLINARKVSMHKKIQTNESTTTDFKLLNLFNI
jgi:hypothetical protein